MSEKTAKAPRPPRSEILEVAGGDRSPSPRLTRDSERRNGGAWRVFGTHHRSPVQPKFSFDPGGYPNSVQELWAVGRFGWAGLFLEDDGAVLVVHDDVAAVFEIAEE